MTGLDLVVIAAVTYALVYFIGVRERLLLTTTRFGLLAVGSGLSLIAIFFVLDLAAMHLLPLFVPRLEAAGFMRALHLEYIWFGIPFGVGAITLGLRINANGLLHLVESLRKNEQLLKVILNASPAGITLRDASGRFLYLNDASAKFMGGLGLDAADLVGNTLDDLTVPASDGETGTDLLLRVAETGESIQNLEFRPPRAPDRTFLTNVVPVFGSDDRISSVVTMNLEITEHKQAEAAARASEARLAGIVESASDAIIAVDRDQRISTFNKGAEKIFGHAAAAVIGQPLDMLIPEAYRTAHGEQIAAFGRSSDVSRPMLDRSEIAGLHKDGTIFPAEASITKLELGAETVFTVFLRDVTERKQAEAAFKESEENFRNLIEGSIQGICILDLSRNLLFANQAYADIFGYASPEEILALKTTAALTAPHEQDRLAGYRLARLRGDYAPTSYEYDGVRKDGSSIRVQVMPRRVLWRGQDAVQVTLFDISGEKRAVETLYGVIDSLQEGFAHYGPDDRLVVCNEEYKRLHPAARDIIKPGMRFEDMIRKTVEQGSFADVAGTVDEMTRARLEMHRNPKGPFMRDLDNGTRYIVKETRTPDGGYFVSQTDITDLTRAEEKLHQAQKMEAVGQLTGGMAHDFNNLLGVIIGNLDFLQEELQGREDLLELVEAATKAALGGATLNGRLLAFSRNQPLAPKVIDPNQQITGMLDILRRTLGEMITVNTVLNDALWTCEVDPTQVESALLNLALNARDAMPAGGAVTIETDNVRLDDAYAAAQSEVTPGDYVMMAVTDTGIGMSPDELDHAFEPFFSTKPVGKGSGLGLSMVFGFAKQSGGHAEIESREAVGTTVKLYWPRVNRAAEQIAEESENPPTSKGETILVVEDDSGLRTLAANLIGSLGYNVREAKDGGMALAAMEEDADHIDLLLTDVVMPGGMNGEALAEEAAARYPALKVLYMSGHSQEMLTHQGRCDNEVLLLRKPFRKNELARMVRAALDGQSNARLGARPDQS